MLLLLAVASRIGRIVFGGETLKQKIPEKLALLSKKNIYLHTYTMKCIMNQTEEIKKKVSKTWEAMQRLKGTVIVNDPALLL